MERLITGRPGTIRLTITDEDGVAVDPLVAPTVTVRDGAGVSVSTGSAVNSADGVGIWTYSIPASVTATIDVYEATWSYTLDGASITARTQIEVCGSHLFEIAELRAYDSVLTDDVDYPAHKIRAARVDAEQRFEKGAERAFTTRPARVRLEGNGRTRLVLPHCDVQELVALEVDGVAVDVDDVEVHSEIGVLEIDGPWTLGSQIDVYYLFGLESAPEPVRRAVKVLAVEYLVPSGLPARATAQSTDLGEFRLSLAGKDGTTGIPEVDSVMMDFGLRRPKIG